MKKTYFKPEVHSHKFGGQLNILAGSPTVGVGGRTFTHGGVGDPSTNGAKGSAFEDDFFEDEPMYDSKFKGGW